MTIISFHFSYKKKFIANYLFKSLLCIMYKFIIIFSLNEINNHKKKIHIGRHIFFLSIFNDTVLCCGIIIHFNFLYFSYVLLLFFVLLLLLLCLCYLFYIFFFLLLSKYRNVCRRYTRHKLIRKNSQQHDMLWVISL